MSQQLRMEIEVLELRTKHPFIIARGGQSDYRTVWVRLKDGDGNEGWGRRRRPSSTARPPRRCWPHSTSTPHPPARGSVRPRAGRTALGGLLAAIPPRERRSPRRSTISWASGWACRSIGCGDWTRRRRRAPPSPSASTSRRRCGRRCEEAEQYPILKIKLGTDRDVEILRDAFARPPTARSGWTPTAAGRSSRRSRMLPVLEEFGVTVLEQPLPPDQLDGLGEIRRRADIPVIADESCETAADIPPLVGKVDGINIKLAKCGSLREAIRMIAIARAHHHDGDGGLHDRELASRSPRPPTSRRWWTSWISMAPRSWPTIPSSAPRIDGGQVRFPPGPGSACAAMTERVRHRRPAAPARHLVHLPHSRDAGRPGRSRGPRRRARSARREMIGIVRRDRRAAPEAAARDLLARTGPDPPCPEPCSRPRGGWPATTARRSASPSSACCPPASGASPRSSRGSRRRPVADRRRPGRRGAGLARRAGRGGAVSPPRAGAQAAGVGRGATAWPRSARVSLESIRPTPRAPLPPSAWWFCTGTADAARARRRSSSAGAAARALRGAGVARRERPVRHVREQLGFSEAVMRASSRRGSRRSTTRGAGARSFRRSPPARRRRRRSRRPRARRCTRSRRSAPGDGGAPLRGDRQRQDSGVPGGDASAFWRRGAGRSCWCPRSGSRRRR